MSQPVLYLMLGYPGAGKTTTAEFIQQLTGAVRLTSDQVRLELFAEPSFTPQEHAVLYKILDERTEALLAAGKSVIYDANLNRYQHRKEKYDICERTGTQPMLFWVKASKELAEKRATELASGDKDRRPYGNMAKDVFERLINEIEPPHASEKVKVIDGSNINKEIIKKALEQARPLTQS